MLQLTALPDNTVLDVYSPTYPADASLFVVVPTIPLVVGLNVILVAVAAPIKGVTSVGV